MTTFRVTYERLLSDGSPDFPAREQVYVEATDIDEAEQEANEFLLEHPDRELVTFEWSGTARMS